MTTQEKLALACRILAMQGHNGEPIVRTELCGEGLRFPVGPHAVEFLMPVDPSSPLINWTRTYGPSPYSATLRSSVAEPKPLEQSLTHGANLYFDGAE